MNAIVIADQPVFLLKISRVKKTAGIFVLTCLLSACATQRKTATLPADALRLIDVYELPQNLSFKHTTVGGLSGIDYDSARQVYYVISDDRSALQPARFYRIKIHLGEKKIDSVQWLDVVNLLQFNGKPYPSAKQDAPDPEAIRYNPLTSELVWASEGEKLLTEKDTLLQNPAIRVIAPNGKHIHNYTLPRNLVMQKGEKGPRQNGTLEGICFANQYKTLYASLEEPLYEDGPRAEPEENNAWIRIYKFDTHTRKNEAQYAYRLDPVAYPAIPEHAFKVNGIPDILDIGGNRLLVMERSFSTGRQACTIKIFLADLNQATDISASNSLQQQPPVKPVTKKLLLNMDQLGIYTDNVEGMTLGPILPSGKRSLIMVADDNFSIHEKTQFFLFEINL